MASVQLLKSRPGSRLGLALLVSALLHGAAVTFASLHQTDSASDLTAPGSDFPIVTIEPEQPPVPLTPPFEIPEPLPPPPLPDDPPHFADPLPAQTPHLPVTLPAPPIPRMPSPARRASSTARAFALHAPLPAYPYEARRARITGAGVAILSVDPTSGRVLSVTMATSTGSIVLDRAALAGLRQWRFRPGTPAQVRCPITYTLTGAAL